jgi:S-formylglutathione hydrolase FrmB
MMAKALRALRIRRGCASKRWVHISKTLGICAVLAVAVWRLQPALLAQTLAAKPAIPSARTACSSVPSQILGRGVGYCVLLPPSYDTEKARRYPTLYVLHGLGDNEQMLLHSGGMSLIEDLWEQHRIGEFLVVTPAGGSSFYIDSHDGRTRYEDFFLQEFMPFIERRFRTQPGRAFRGIGGISMGGYGALHLAFGHPELFSSVSAHSAAIMERAPALQTGPGGGLGRLQLFGDVFGSPIDRAFWDRNNPLAMARTANLAGLKIYFDCGSEDDYGFNVGAEALHSVLVARHIPHEFHLYPGGHNWDYFASHLPASLEFHAHVFASQSPGR